MQEADNTKDEADKQFQPYHPNVRTAKSPGAMSSVKLGSLFYGSPRGQPAKADSEAPGE